MHDAEIGKKLNNIRTLPNKKGAVHSHTIEGGKVMGVSSCLVCPIPKIEKNTRGDNPGLTLIK